MAHNGGLAQINLSELQAGGDFPFLNHFLNGQTFTTINNHPPDFQYHDDNGYMHTTYDGGVRTFYNIPTQDERPGNYVALWDGGGTISHSTALAPGQSKTGLAAEDNRCEFVTPGSSLSFGVESVASNGTDYPHNIAFCHVDDEAACLAGRAYIRLGQVPPGNLFFGVKFLERLVELKPGAIRFHGQNDCKQTSHALWGNRKPVGYYDYAGGNYVKKSIYAGTTAGTGDDYTAALSGFALTDKNQVIVRWDRTSLTGFPRANINGTGLKAVKDSLVNNEGGPEILFSARYPLANTTCALTFDETLDCYIMNGGSTERNYGGVCPGWPIEIMMALCVHIGAHCSIPMPHFALDPPTDLTLGICEYAKTVLTPAGLKLQLEGPNEQWNFLISASYYFARAKENTGVGLRTDKGYHEWYGRAVAKMGEIMLAAFGNGKGVGYDCIAGVWTSNASSNQHARIESPRYVLEGGIAAYTVLTEVHLTGYWNASKYGLAQETTAAADYAAAVGATAKAAVVDAYMSLWTDAGLATLYAKYLDWRTYLNTLPVVLGLAQYEGGYSPDYGGNAEINTFRAATKNWPDLYFATLINHQTFVNTYGGVMPSEFQMSGATAWPMLDATIFVAVDPPRWTANVHFNHGIRRYRFSAVVEVDPVISGYNYLGGTLSVVSNGTYRKGTPSFAHQWKRNGVNIGGATSSSYVMTASDIPENITYSEIATINGIVQTAKSSNTIVGAAASAEAINFLNRTSGLDSTHVAMYIALIDGLVADGVFSLLDALYFVATQNEATAKLNLVGTSYPPIETGSVAFAADEGFTAPAGTTDYISSGFNPFSAGGHFSQNSAHLSIWMEAGTGNGIPKIGAYTSSPSVTATIYPNFSNSFLGRLNNGINNGVSFAVANPEEISCIVSRTASNLTAGYLDGVSVATSAQASTGMVNLPIIIGGANIDSVPTSAAYKWSSASIGAGLDATQALALYDRLSAARTAVGL